MFWAVYYAAVFGAVALVVGRLPVIAAACVLAGAVLLQAVDLNGMYRITSASTAQRVVDPLPSEFWDLVLPYYKHVVLYPTNICGVPGALDYRFFALHAGRAGATINGGNAARGDVAKVMEYCRAYAQDMQNGNIGDDSVYVMGPARVPQLQAAAKKPLTCAPVDGFGVCFTSASHVAWRHEFDIARLPRR